MRYWQWVNLMLAAPHTDNTDTACRGQGTGYTHRYTAVRWSCAPPQVWFSTGARLARLHAGPARARHIHYFPPFIAPPQWMTDALHSLRTTLPLQSNTLDDFEATNDLSCRVKTSKSLASNSAARLLPAITMNTLFSVTVLSRVTFVGGEAWHVRSGHSWFTVKSVLTVWTPRRPHHQQTGGGRRYKGDTTLSVVRLMNIDVFMQQLPSVMQFTQDPQTFASLPSHFASLPLRCQEQLGEEDGG